MGFPRQDYWNGLPFPLPGNFLHPGSEPASPALAGRFFTTEPRGKPCVLVSGFVNFVGRTGSLSFSRCFGALRIALRRMKCSWYLNHLKHLWLKHGLRLYLAAFPCLMIVCFCRVFPSSCVNVDNLYFARKLYILAPILILIF